MRIVKNPEERKQEIISAAIRVFAKKGYEKTTISDIAREMGISQGLCYRYFPTKEAIYDAGIEEYADFVVSQTMRRIHTDDKSLKERILIMSGQVGEYTTVEKEQGDLYEYFHKQGNQKLHDQLYLKAGLKLIPYIIKVLEDSNTRGETKISDPEATAHFFVFGQIGMLMNHEIPEEEKRKRIQECLIELLNL